MIINDPEVVAEWRSLNLRYESTMVTNGVETLIPMFWTSEQVMRFGATENLYGPEELEALRKGRPSANLTRTVTQLDIVSFGWDYASVTLEFERSGTAGITRGRQSQVWVRLPRVGALFRRMFPYCRGREVFY